MNNPLKIIPKLSLYYKVIPTFEEQKEDIKNKTEFEGHYAMARIWKRYDIEFNELIFEEYNANRELNFKEAIKEITDFPDFYYKNFRIKKEVMASKESYEEFIKNKIKENPKKKSFLNWEGKINITHEKFNQNDEELHLIEVSLINNTKEPEVNSKSLNKYEPALFNPSLEITCENEIIPFMYNYEYEGKSKKYESYFRCNNCQASLNKSKNLITTQVYGEFEERKVIPKSHLGNIDISFKKMSSSDNLTD